MSGYYPLYVGAAYPTSGGGGGGDMVLASVQTVTGAKTFNDSTLLLANVAGTFSSKFTNTNSAARTYTLPDAAGTIALTSNITGTNSGTNTGDQTITLTGAVTGSGTGSFVASLGSFTKAQLDAAVSDANVMYVGDAPTAHVHAGADITTGTVDPARLGSGASITTKFLRGDSTWQTITTGSGDALVANPLSQFAATTSAQLAGVISDKTGSGALVFATSPTLVTPNIGAATGTSLNLSSTITAVGYSMLGGLRINGADPGNTIYLSTGSIGINAIGGNVNIGGVSGISLSAVYRSLTFNATGGDGTDGCFFPNTDADVNNTQIFLGKSSNRFAGLFVKNITASGTVTIGGGTAIAKVLSATATLDFPSIASNDTQTLTMTVSGAAAGNAVFLGVPAALDANLIWCASVTAADTVTIRMHNASGSSVDPASGTYRATVFQF